MKQKSFFKSLFFITLVVAPLMANCKPLPITKNELHTATPTSTVLSPTALPTTKTLIPTLTSDQRLLQIKEWLVTNAGCKLPCWWGLAPGKATWDEVDEFLNRLGTTSEIYKTDGMIIHEAKGMNFDQERIINLVSFVEDKNLVTGIIIDSSGYNDSPNFKSIWASFSPENIILEYGVPSRVWIKSGASVHEGSPGPTAPYSVWLFYDHLGILVRYDGQVKYESIYKMCPVFSKQGNLSDYVNIYLQSANANLPIESLSDIKAYGTKPISLEEAAGITPKELYMLFIEPDVEPCFETSRDIWK